MVLNSGGLEKVPERNLDFLKEYTAQGERFKGIVVPEPKPFAGFEILRIRIFKFGSGVYFLGASTSIRFTWVR